MNRRKFVIGVGAFAIVRCGGSPPRPTPSAAVQTLAIATATPIRTTPTVGLPLPTATEQPVPTPVPEEHRLEPRGFPIGPETIAGVVHGQPGARSIDWGKGPKAAAYSREDQVSDDAERANRSGWNARTHVDYEGQPAVDWYLPEGTPVLATLDGQATLLVNTVSNPFTEYRGSREPYLGNPDRSRAPIVPFNGPGGGQGTFVRIENSDFRIDLAHLTVARTLRVVPADAFLPAYSATFDYLTAFAPLRDFRVATAVARWTVRRGDVVGFSGDSGYSEGPHLHYAIRRSGSDNALCPTLEHGFDDAGWLFKN